MSRTLALQIAILLAAIPAVMRTAGATHTPRFAVPIAGGRVTEAPKFEREFLPMSATKLAHAPSAVELRNGDLLALWYGGAAEMQPDVRIMASRLDHETRTWSAPATIETAATASAGIGWRVKSLGNPVLYADGDELILYYTAVSVGGWSGGTICMKRSADGVQWSPARRIHASPFMNLSMLVKGQPIPYVDGTVALPVYHQMLHRWSGVLRVTRDGDVVDLARIDAAHPVIQPWIVPMSFTRAIAFMRWSDRMPGNVTVATTEDAGRHWGAAARTGPMHRDSAVAAARLSDGSLLLAYNNMAWDRRELALTRSDDAARRWSKRALLESDHEPPSPAFLRDYAYPYLIRTSDGMFHLFYSWRRQRIVHVRFNEAWIFANRELMTF